MIGGLFFSTCVMIFYFVRQLLGTPMDPPDVVLGVAKAFLVSYAGTGFFVWYLLRVAERNLNRPSPNVEADESSYDDDEDEWEEHNGLPPEESEEQS